MISKTTVKHKNWLFFILTFGLSWLFWVPSAMFGHDFQRSLWLIPFMLGGFGPSVAGIIMSFLDKDDPLQRNFFKRVIDFRRISGIWYAVIFLVFPLTLLLAVLIQYLFQNQFPSFKAINQILANPLTLIGAVLMGMITGPISEELGWRGYGQGQLQRRWHPLLSSLILAPIWWAWHLPLFFMPGTTHYQWGVGTIHFWIFLIGTFPLTILLAWGYNHNGRSILAAILMHFMANFTLGLLHPMPELLHALYVLLLSLAALGIVKLFGPGN